MFNNCLKTPSCMSLKFYKNGMIVQDGPLRSYEDPATTSFLKDILDGYFPSELQEAYPEGVPFKVKHGFLRCDERRGKGSIFGLLIYLVIRWKITGANCSWTHPSFLAKVTDWEKRALPITRSSLDLVDPLPLTREWLVVAPLPEIIWLISIPTRNSCPPQLGTNN